MYSRFSLASALACMLASPSVAEEVVVFAAASLKGALDALAAEFQTATGATVIVNYGGSSALAKQIIEGAPADIFVSAAVNWMDEVEKAGMVADGTRRNLLGNGLVLVAHGQGAALVNIAPGFDLAGLLGDGKLSMAMVDAVPAGQYGQSALKSLGVWAQIEPFVAQSENASAALRLVSIGEAPLGIVYASDALGEDSITVVGTFPPDSHPPIVYPGALLAGAADKADKAFFDVLSSDAGDATFAQHGFVVLN